MPMIAFRKPSQGRTQGWILYIRRPKIMIRISRDTSAAFFCFDKALNSILRQRCVENRDPP
jgi:hypothetical protein